MSYVSGANAVPLRGETIGQQLDRTATRFPDGLALVVRQQKLRLTWRELREEVDRLAAGLLAIGIETGDRVGILVAQQRRMGADATRNCAGRPGAGVHQPGLPAARARLCAQQGGLPRAGDGDRLQDQRLCRHAYGAAAGTRSLRAGRIACDARPFAAQRRPDRRAEPARQLRIRRGDGPRRSGRARPADPARGPRAVRRPREHPVHLRHHGIAQGRDAHPS